MFARSSFAHCRTRKNTQQCWAFRSQNTKFSKERFRVQVSTAKCTETLRHGTGTAGLKKFFGVPLANAGREWISGFQKHAVGICGMPERPGITEVTGRISSGKDMGESVRKPVVAVKRTHLNARLDFSPQCICVMRFFGIIRCEQLPIERAKRKLPYTEQRSMKKFPRQKFLDLFLGKRRAGFLVCSHAFEHFPFPAVVFHELARELDHVPFHVLHAKLTARSFPEKVVEIMPELVKECQYFLVVPKVRLFSSGGFGKVTDEVGDR